MDAISWDSAWRDAALDGADGDNDDDYDDQQREKEEANDDNEYLVRF